MLKEAMKYLVDLAKQGEIVEVDGHKYSPTDLNLVTLQKPERLEVSTLTAIVDYIKSNFDNATMNPLMIQVESPTKVVLLSQLDNANERTCFMTAEALLPRIPFNDFLDTERFNIMLQSDFVASTDKDILLKVTGCIQDKAVKEIGDDGISQAVTIKTGVAKVDNVLVPNPVTLAPYRTFPEVPQIESKFIFRMKEGPYAALFEADGGAWRNKAMDSIKEFFEDKLMSNFNVQIIS